MDRGRLGGEFITCKYGFLKNFGIGFDAHQIDPEKWVDLTIKSIKLGELFRNMTAFPKLTKDQLYDLFLIYIHGNILSRLNFYIQRRGQTHQTFEIITGRLK